MGLADTFGAEDRVQVKFSDFYKLMKQATQYEIAINAVRFICGIYEYCDRKDKKI